MKLSHYQTKRRAVVRKLQAEADKFGVCENFGQREVRALRSEMAADSEVSHLDVQIEVLLLDDSVSNIVPKHDV